MQLGMDFDFTLDMNFGYTLPLEEDGNYQKVSFMPFLLFGGRSYVTLYLGPIRARMFAEVNGFKGVTIAYFMWNVIKYGNFCTGVYQTYRAMRIDIYPEIDVLECSFGTVGWFEINQTTDCNWQNYIIDEVPLFEITMPSFYDGKPY